MDFRRGVVIPWSSPILGPQRAQNALSWTAQKRKVGLGGARCSGG